MVPGGDRAPLHRPARLLLPQRDAPHAEARHHHHPAPRHPGEVDTTPSDRQIFSLWAFPFKYNALSSFSLWAFALQI